MPRSQLRCAGEDDGDAGVRLAHELMRRAYLVPGAKVHWYGKAGMRTGRKVGTGSHTPACRPQAAYAV
jgi:phosphoribosylaminoimidazole carboxylase (NCAIR synthetase)